MYENEVKRLTDVRLTISGDGGGPVKLEVDEKTAGKEEWVKTYDYGKLWQRKCSADEFDNIIGEINI